jgi:hypothetical protein
MIWRRKNGVQDTQIPLRVTYALLKNLSFIYSLLKGVLYEKFQTGQTFWYVTAINYRYDHQGRCKIAQSVSEECVYLTARQYITPLNSRLVYDVRQCN